jgi:hypothetical protein
MILTVKKQIICHSPKTHVKTAWLLGSIVIEKGPAPFPQDNICLVNFGYDNFIG